MQRDMPAQERAGMGFGVVPVHLRGADRIAKTFGVTRTTVIAWQRRGGPVARVGRVYMAEYNALMAWLVAGDGSGGMAGDVAAEG